MIREFLRFEPEANAMFKIEGRDGAFKCIESPNDSCNCSGCCFDKNQSHSNICPILKCVGSERADDKNVIFVEVDELAIRKEKDEDEFSEYLMSSNISAYDNILQFMLSNIDAWDSTLYNNMPDAIKDNVCKIFEYLNDNFGR